MDQFDLTDVRGCFRGIGALTLLSRVMTMMQTCISNAAMVAASANVLLHRFFPSNHLCQVLFLNSSLSILLPFMY